MEALFAAPVTQESVVVRLKQFVMARFVGGYGAPIRIRFQRQKKKEMVSVVKPFFQNCVELRTFCSLYTRS